MFWKTLQSPDAVAPSQLNVCSCFEAAHFNLRSIRAGLDFTSPGGGCILETANFRTRRTAERQCLRLFAEAFEMIIEITTVLFLVQGASLLSRLIERRNDVLYYVSKPDQRW